MESAKRRQYNFNMRQKYGLDWDSPLKKINQATTVVDTSEPKLEVAQTPEVHGNEIALQNRVENFHKNVKPILTLREFEVLEAVKKIQPCTMHQVAKFMQRELNTISGRFGALVEKGYLSIKGKTEDHKSLYITTQTNGEITQ